MAGTTNSGMLHSLTDMFL